MVGVDGVVDDVGTAHYGPDTVASVSRRRIPLSRADRGQ
jgi:hypothetical protein